MFRFSVFSRACYRTINALNQGIGVSVSWLTLTMVLTTFIIVVLRYSLDFGSIGLQESVGYMHAMVFMLGAAYTLKTDGHVRVDILYQRCSKPVRAWIDCLGVVLLLGPVAAFMLWSSWGYVADSWQIQEASNNSGGLPGVYLIKSLIIVTALLLSLQGLSMFLSSLNIALGLTDGDE